MRITVRATVFLIALGLLSACATVAPQDSMQADVEQAAAIIERFQAIPESGIPPAVMRAARGLAILNVTKAGFLGSVKGGTGIVIARTANGWSGPSAIGTGGVGFGFQAGIELSELVIVLNTPSAVEAFAKGGNVTLGAALGVAVGPVGRTTGGDLTWQAAMYTYSRTQGLFAGVSVEGAGIGTRSELNAAYYGKPVLASDILGGKVQPPARAQKLLAVLAKQ